jgi:Acyltransferase family
MSHEKLKLPFLSYINHFRSIAILIIVAGHAIPALNWHDKYNFLLANIVLSNGTVFFVFIAGYLFQYLLRNYEYKSYLLKKLKFVILPYCLTSIPAIAAYFLGIASFPEGFEKFVVGLPPLQIIVLCLITGKHLGPFWFIPMISVFYILAPLFIKINKSRYSVPIIVILSVLIPLIFPRTLPTSYIHFLPAYLLGMLVCRDQDRIFNFVKKQSIWLYSLVLILWGIQFLLIYRLNISDRLFDSPFFGINTVVKEIFSILIIYFLSGLTGSNSMATRFLYKCSVLLAELSFGIYFIHDYILRIYFLMLRHYAQNISWLLDGNLFIISISSCIIILVSIGVLLASKKVLAKNSRYILGC